VTPVGNAVCFVDHQQRYLCGDTSQYLLAKVLVRQALRRDQQDVDLTLGQLSLDCRPGVHVVGIDRGGSNPHPLSRSDLVPHQCQQRRDQQRRPVAGLSQQLGCDEVNEALTPAGLLHDQQAALALDDVADGTLLAATERGVGATATRTKQIECSLRVVNQVMSWRHACHMPMLLRVAPSTEPGGDSMTSGAPRPRIAEVAHQDSASSPSGGMVTPPGSTASRAASSTAWVRLLAPSLRRIAVMCALTVASDTSSA